MNDIVIPSKFGTFENITLKLPKLSSSPKYGNITI